MDPSSDGQVRHRGVGDHGDAKESDEELDQIITDEGETENEQEPASKPAPSNIPWVDLSPLLSALSPKWRNWVIRGVFSMVMIGGFGWLISKGPLALMITVLLIQVKCFSEIIAIGLAVYRVYDLPWFRALSWYFLITSNYFFYGESLIDYWGILLRKDNFLSILTNHHRFTSFALYILGFVWFVLSLKKGYYMRQFSLFAWTHVTLLLIVSQSYLIIQNIFQGLIWFLVPVSMIICNDIMAYMFGFFFGKTPLIKLSPKKTWEGFIGGALSTVVFGLLLSYTLLHYPFFVCPLEYQESSESFTNDCTIPPTFQLRPFELPHTLHLPFKMLKRDPVITVYPFLGHAFIMSLFASLIGPFGGFFASGFKRAFKIKDFGDVIPGHGGLMDRFDCQLLMGSFVNVYIHTFIRIPNPVKMVAQIMLLKPEQQMHVYNLLKEKLIQKGLINPDPPIQ